MNTADIGLIGLAVMGQNLALNLNDHHHRVIVFNRSAEKTAQFMAGAAQGTAITAAYQLADLVSALAKPRKILLMVQAGAAVDAVIAQLLPLLGVGDILMDGGNSNFVDTQRRVKELAAAGILFLGTGISGGEEGARHGPSIMPGGNPAAWSMVKPLLQSIAAKVEGEPCCQWVGNDGAGHYVKMVHNGIEYGDMQLIGEAYQLLHEGLGLTTAQMASIFEEWNRGKLESYLIEITAKILRFNDADGQPLLDKIVDTAGQKGTGLWTAHSALELGIPLTLINAAVAARALSALKSQRGQAAAILGDHKPPLCDTAHQEQQQGFINALEDALYAAKIISYAQGFMLLHQAATTYHWQLDYGAIALMWRGGCIIRSAFLGKIKAAYAQNPQLQQLLLDDFFHQALKNCESGWRKTCVAALHNGYPIPAFSASLSFYDGYRSARLPANLLQAQRDFFGAHTYERLDRPRGEFFHTVWEPAPPAP